jgi:hypothetical protein
MWLGSLLHIVFHTNSFHALFESFDANWSSFLTQVATAAVIHVLRLIFKIMGSTQISLKYSKESVKM